jgi:uncharacterized membrane protein YfcA
MGKAHVHIDTVDSEGNRGVLSCVALAIFMPASVVGAIIGAFSGGALKGAILALAVAGVPFGAMALSAVLRTRRLRPQACVRARRLRELGFDTRCIAKAMGTTEEAVTRYLGRPGAT